MKTFAWVALVGAVVAAASFAALGCGDPGLEGGAQQQQKQASTIDEQLAQDMGIEDWETLQLMPAERDGLGVKFPKGPEYAYGEGWRYVHAAGSPLTRAPGGIFQALLANSGITPCSTRPEIFAEKPTPGFLKLETQSMVVDANGSRATFGYWIASNRRTNGLHDVYFVLFSYDHVNAKQDDGTTICKCAEEVFVFGPMHFEPAATKPNELPPPLIGGYAVNGADGKLLDAVPLEIAQVFNYDGGGKYLDGQKHKKGEAVKPGVTTAGQGCRLCHGTNVDEIPQVTRQFPWFGPEPTDGGAPDGGDDAGADAEARPARVG